MAEVYRARDIRLDRMVAIKTLRADLARDQTFQARFRREAQSAASLNHPSIVAVYDTGEDMSTGVPYIVMEYVDGRTVRDLLIEGHRLLPQRALEITQRGAARPGVQPPGGHRAPGHQGPDVMVSRSGDIKVMDFGIARAMSDARATMTSSVQIIGSVKYMSPEQARGQRVDARSDLYSTGCLMYELLTGRPPFTGTRRSPSSTSTSASTRTHRRGWTRTSRRGVTRGPPCGRWPSRRTTGTTPPRICGPTFSGRPATPATEHSPGWPRPRRPSQAKLIVRGRFRP